MSISDSRPLAKKTTAKPPEATDLFKIRKHFLELSLAITENYLKQLDYIVRLQDEGFPQITELLADCGVSEAEHQTYAMFGATMQGHGKILRAHSVAPNVINALVHADEAVRLAAIRQIENGARLSIDDLAKIASAHAADSKSEDQKFIDMGKKSLREAVEAKARTTEDDFRGDAATLHQMMVSYAEKPSDQKHADIATLAHRLLDQFEALFGTDFPPTEDWLFVGLQNPARKHLAQAHFALGRLSGGLFRVGFPRLQSRYSYWSSFDAVRYLAGINDAVEPRPTRKAPAELRKLSAVQIGVDSGGLTLGLEAARFEIVAITELDWDETDAFIANRSGYNVEAISLGNLAGMARIAPRHLGTRTLDVLAGNLFRPNVSASDNYATWNKAVDCLGAIKPRSFFFRIDRALYNAKANIKNRQKHLKILQEGGYRFTFLDIRASDVGLPQDQRVDTFMVGAQSDPWSRFQPPRAVNSQSNLNSVLSSHAFPYWSKTRQPNVNGTSFLEAGSEAQGKYDRWADNWVTKYGSLLGPDVSQFWKGNPDDWNAKGLTLKLHETFPRVGDDQAMSGKPLPLNSELLALLQGFPAGWSFAGEGLASQAALVSQATPPLLAHAIAQSLRTALTGEQIDLDHDQAGKIQARLPVPPAFVLDPSSSSYPDYFLAKEWRQSMIEQEQLDRVGFDDDHDDDD
jgi:DNA (cytosine-5)-methyltransferase 1